MEIKIDFGKKEISITGKVNLQELVIKLSELSIDLNQYTIEQEKIYLPSLGNWQTGSSNIIPLTHNIY